MNFIYSGLYFFLYAGMYFLSACMICFVLVTAMRRSAFGILIASALVWFLIGGCIYPLFDLLGFVERQDEVSDFIARHGPPGIGTAVHILCMSTGMLLGYFWRSQLSAEGRAMRMLTRQIAKVRGLSVWHCSILLGLVSYAVYFKLVGVDVALMNAAAARGGDFLGFGDSDRFLFLKTVAAIGLVATCYLPIALMQRRRIFVLLYCALIVIAYSNSISRNLLLYSAIVPILVYVRIRSDIRKKGTAFLTYIAVAALAPFALMVLHYGKIMGHRISAYFNGNYYSLVEEVGEAKHLDTLLNNFGFQWVSVQAGIDHFFRTGFPLVTQEQFLATFFGAIPSRVLSSFGLESLYYGNVKPSLTCINSWAFGYVDCTVPPLAIAYSAYLIPGVGGILLGFLWLRVFASIEKVWMAMQKEDWRKLWVPYFLWGAFFNFFTFLPTAVALTTAQFLWLIFLAYLRPARTPRLYRPSYAGPVVY